MLPAEVKGQSFAGGLGSSGDCDGSAAGLWDMEMMLAALATTAELELFRCLPANSHVRGLLAPHGTG